MNDSFRPTRDPQGGRRQRPQWGRSSPGYPRRRSAGLGQSVDTRYSPGGPSERHLFGIYTTLAQRLTLAASGVDQALSVCAALSGYEYPLHAAIGSIRLGSLFLRFPTRVLTGQHVISSEGNGASRALSADASVGSSPSQTDHVSGLRTTGMRL
jgi:hypothetical protein